MKHFAALFAVLVGLNAASTSACGPDSDCALGERTYRIDLPEVMTKETGALIFAHGYRGSARGTMRNKALRALASEMGIALVAADTAGDDWVIPGVPRNTGNDGSEETAYFDDLIADLRSRHGLNTDQLVMSGFSAGGMMVWQLACQRGQSFRAFIPIAGTFWAPVPDACSTRPNDIVHIHGTGDKIVPLLGRAIADTKQGEVPRALELARNSGTFSAPERLEDGDLTCEREEANDGRILMFCIHSGGHSIRMDHLRTAFRVLKSRGVFPDS